MTLTFAHAVIVLQRSEVVSISIVNVIYHSSTRLSTKLQRTAGLNHKKMSLLTVGPAEMTLNMIILLFGS